MKLHFVESMDEVLKLALEREIVALAVRSESVCRGIAGRPPRRTVTH